MTRKINQKDYKFYVCLKDGSGRIWKIESGWEYKGDAQDHIRGNLPRDWRGSVVAKKTLIAAGIDPDDNANWGSTGAASKNPPKGSGKPISLSLEAVFKSFGLEDENDFLDHNMDNIGQAAYEEVKAISRDDPDLTQEELDEISQKAEQAQQDDLYKQYQGAIEAAIGQTFAHIGLAAFVDWGKQRVTLEPEKSWDDSLWKIVRVVNGIGSAGDFELARTTRDVLNVSSVRTARQFVEEHAKIVRSYAEVYGGMSPKRIYQGSFR